MTKLEKMAIEEAKKRVKNIVANDHNEQRIADAALEIVQAGISDIYMTGFRSAKEMMKEKIEGDGYYEYYEKDLLKMLDLLGEDEVE